MSYRSIKRVLGETSLELKCLLLFGFCLLSLIFASFWWYGSKTEEMVYRQNRNTGRLLVDQAMLTKHWEALETNERFLPIVDVLSDDLSKQQYQVEYLRPGMAGQSDAASGSDDRDKAFHQQVLETFMKAAPVEPDNPDEPEEFMERLLVGSNEYEYYRPIRAEESCLTICHRAPPGGAGIDSTGLPLAGGGLFTDTALMEGDLMAVVKVTISNDRTQRALDWNWAILWTTAIATAGAAMIASYLIVRYVIVKPLRHLRDVSNAISHGNISLRADIHTGDEFESLAVAFNRMLHHLVTIQDELRDVNADLDGKVDELAQVNMRLYEMNTIKSDFLATMSHELRTPLNSILGFSDVLVSIDSLNDKQKRYVQNIQSSGRMLLEMINDILDLAKIESGKMDTRLTDFAVEQVIGAQCDMARPLMERKNIDLECRVAADLPPMHQDQARVQQVLNNLLSNAIKFTPEGGRITVGAERDEEGFLVMQVIDTGVGIAEEDQQSIFEKFRQGRTAMPTGDPMTREHSGTGLGLSITRELCKLLGGEVLVESELGMGSTFTVRLPWTLQEQPRLDSALVESFEEFTKNRFDSLRDRGHRPAEPASQAAE